MEEDQINRINMQLISLNSWSSIYESDASNELVELRDQIHELQLDLQATAAVLPIDQQESQPQDVDLKPFEVGPLSAIPSEPGKIDELESKKVPRLQQLLRVFRRPITPEKLNEMLPILNSIPPLIDEFLNKRLVMINQIQQQQQQQPQSQQQQPQPQLQQPQSQQQQPQPQQQQPQPQQPDLPGSSGMGRQLPPQPGVIGCPRARINRQALQQLKQILRNPTNTPEKQKRILHILNSNPPLKAALIKQRQNRALQQQSDQHGAGGAIAMGSSQSQQLQHQQQPQQQLSRLNMLAQQHQQLGQAGRTHRPFQNILNQQQQHQQQVPLGMGGMGGQLPHQPGVIGGPSAQIDRQALQQVKQLLRRPMTPEKQNQILHILNSNPSLRAAFIKQRQALALQRKIKQQALQHLMKILRSPNTPEQQNQILYVFKTKPYLMDELIKDRENFDSCLRWLISFSESDLEVGSSPTDENQVHPQDAQNSSVIERRTQRKVQNYQCNDANREPANRKKLNSLAAYLENCKKGMNGNCLACKRFRNFYGHHAILCQLQDNECSIPFCFDIKRKLNQLPECKKSLQARLIGQNRY